MDYFDPFRKGPMSPHLRTQFARVQFHSAGLFGDRASRPADYVERFLEWQRGITAAAEASPGYRRRRYILPADPRQSQWVVLIHFESSEALQRWLASAARAEWTAKLPAEIGTFG